MVLRHEGVIGQVCGLVQLEEELQQHELLMQQHLRALYVCAWVCKGAKRKSAQ